MNAAFAALMALMMGSSVALAAHEWRERGEFHPAFPSDPLIEVGAAARASTGRSMDVELQVEFGGVSGNSDCDGKFCSQTYYARIEADFGAGTDGTIPDYRIRIAPGGIRTGVGPLDILGADFIPIEVSRDIRLGEDFNVSIRAASARFNFPIAADREYKGDFVLAATLAVEAMGVRIAGFSDGLGSERGEIQNFFGFDLADLAGELRAYFRTSPDTSVTFALGGTVGASAGWSDADGPWYLRRGAYADARVNLGRFVQLFLRGGTEWSFGSARDEDVPIYEAMSGIRLVY